MKKFRNKLSVTDLDGTFFNSNRQLVKRNLDAIEYFKENGGLFTIASGREPLTMGSVGPIAATLTNAPAILANGSFTYNFGQKSMHNFMELDYEKATEMLALVRQEFPHLPFMSDPLPLSIGCHVGAGALGAAIFTDYDN